MTGLEQQNEEIQSLRSRLDAAERKIKILTETLSTLKDMRTSEQMNTFLSSQTRLLSAADFLNSVSDREKFDLEEQRKFARQLEQQKRELDGKIDAAVKASREQSLSASNSRITEALGKWRAQQPETELESVLKFLSYRIESGGITIASFNAHYDFNGQLIIPEILKIPDTIEGMPVTRIDSGAFRGVRLKRIILPEHLEIIGMNAFSACRLSEIQFPDSLEAIGAGAFASCDFTEVHLENTRVKVIADKCFGWCGMLKKVVFPDTLLSIENNAFVECGSLRQFIIPEDARSVVSPFSNSSVERSIAVLGMKTELSELCGISILGGAGEITVYCLPDSSAQKYCLANGVPCRHLSEFIEE